MANDQKHRFQINQYRQKSSQYFQRWFIILTKKHSSHFKIESVGYTIAIKFIETIRSITVVEKRSTQLYEFW